MTNYRLTLSLYLLVLLCSCDQWDLDQQSFLQVELTLVDSLSIDSLLVTAVIKDYTIGQIQEHGFLWTTTDEDPPTIFFRQGVQDLGIRTLEENDSSFASAISLRPNTRYTIRAYVTLDGSQYTYSNEISYQTGRAEIFTTSIDYESGFSLNASGELTGMDKGYVAVEHGFCWSTTGETPTLDDQFLNLGERRSNEPFTGTISDLQNNQSHYIRSYAILSQDFVIDTVYGQVLEFDGDLRFWSQKANYGGGEISAEFGFSVGSQGYVGSGFSSVFWAYDPVNDLWTQKADFAGVPRFSTLGFAIEDKGYVGTGSTSDVSLTDFWMYDPQVNAWVRKADFQGGARYSAVGFSIENKGYIGTGVKGESNVGDFWEYDPQSDQWSRRADLPGVARNGAVGFSIGNKGYLGTGASIVGVSSGDEDLQDIWEYDPQVNAWARKADFQGGARSAAVGFSIGNKGYIGTGVKDLGFTNDFWVYQPQQDSWTRGPDFEGIPRSYPVGFAIDNMGYLGLGTSNTRNETDFWEYDP